MTRHQSDSDVSSSDGQADRFGQDVPIASRVVCAITDLNLAKCVQSIRVIASHGRSLLTADLVTSDRLCCHSTTTTAGLTSEIYNASTPPSYRALAAASISFSHPIIHILLTDQYILYPA